MNLANSTRHITGSKSVFLHCYSIVLTTLGVISVARQSTGAPPRARIPSTFAPFLGFRSCWYTHFVSKVHWNVPFPDFKKTRKIFCGGGRDSSLQASQVWKWNPVYEHPHSKNAGCACAWCYLKSNAEWLEDHETIDQEVDVQLQSILLTSLGKLFTLA